MARDYYDESKKKKETKQKAKSPSVTKKNNTRTQQAQNQKTYGGVQKPAQRSTTKQTSQRTQQAQQQKSQGDIQRRAQQSTPIQRRTNAESNNLLKQRRIQENTQSRQQEPTRRIDRTTSANEMLKARQVQRSGVQNDTNDQLRTERRQRMAERQEQARQKKMGLAPEDRASKEESKAANTALKNTPELMGKALKDTASGYKKAIYDLTDVTASNKNGAKAKAMKMGYEPDDTDAISRIEEERKRTAEKSRQERIRLGEEQEKRQAAWDEKTKGAGRFAKAYYGAVESGTGMLADLAVGALTGTGQAGALASMGLRTYGQQRGQAEKEGATENEDRLYSLLQAGKEVGTELMFPGAGLARKAYGKAGIPLAERTANALVKGLTGKKADLVSAGTHLLGGVAEENLEEVAGWGLDPLIKELAYGRNVRERTKETLKAGLPEINSEEDAARVSSYIGSGKFTDDLVSEYTQSGMAEEDARQLANKMRDYYSAYYSGDTETFERLEDELSEEISGQKKLSKSSWSYDELLDTVASTTLLTGATGLPGAVTTSIKGHQVFDSPEMKEKFGEDAARIIADAVRNSSSEENSLRAEAMKERLESGKDLTGTQKYQLYQGYLEKAKDTSKKAQASDQVVQQARQDQNLELTSMTLPNGQRVYNKATQEAFNESYANAATTVEALRKYMDSDSSISEDEGRRADAAISAISHLAIGGLTVGDAHEFAYGNNLAREALKADLGIDLDHYVVRDKNGNIDYAATNEATETALFEMNAANAIEMARVETDRYIDDKRGEMDTDLMSRFESEGSAAWKDINKDLDPRDLNQYLTTANATSYYYAAGRNTDMTAEEAINSAGRIFQGVDQSVFRKAFEAGQKDKIIANTPGYGQAVEAGQNLKLKDTTPILTGNLNVEEGLVVPDSIQSAYLALAQATSSNIHLVSSMDLTDKEGKPVIRKDGSVAQANGSSKGNDIYINVNSNAEQNLGYVFMHEMTHQIKTFAPDDYKKLEDLVRDRWFRKDYEGMQKAIRNKQDLYKAKANQNLSEEEALEEIIADAMAQAIDDPNFAAEVCATDESLATAILNSIKNALRNIRNLFAANDFQDANFHNGLLEYLDILDEAEHIWLNALAAAKQEKAENGLAKWEEKAYQNNRYSVGYHAGDLGKSTVDDYYNQGYGRGTGHFGFGTYFVGNPDRIKNYNKRGDQAAPVETVDFDKYNLFKPDDFEQGIRLHDALKLIDGYVTEYSKFDKSRMSADEYTENYLNNTSRINRAAEELVSDYGWNDYQWDDSTREYKEQVDKYIADNLDEYDRNELERKARRKYEETQNRSTDEEEVRKELARNYETYKNMHDFFGNPFIRESSVEEYIQNELEDTIRYRNMDKAVPYDYYYYDEAKEAIKDASEHWEWENDKLGSLVRNLVPALGYKHSSEEIANALRKTEEIVNEYVPEGKTRMDAKRGLDSSATVFMKQLGYEGVDVRHINDLDNTGFGSVIYDLKDEDLARKQEIGTARFSISEMPAMSEIDQTNTTIEDDEGNAVAHFQDNGDVSFSISSYESEGRKIYTDYLDKLVADGELSRKEADTMLNELETIYKISKDLADTGEFAPYTAWSYANVERDSKGKPVFSAIKKNSEYKMNIDFSTICKKRRTLDAVFREMINRGMFEKLDLNKDESAAMVVNINNLIRQHKFEAACALCFVEARRYRQQQTAKTFTDMWNKLVESMYTDKSKIAYFNYGEDSTVNDVPDGIHTMSEDDLDLTYIRSIADAKKADGKPVQSAEAKAARLILKDPSQRKLMRVGDMMASTGFENMHKQNPELEKVYNSKKGTGGAKSSFGDVQYLNEIISSKTFDRQKAYDVSGVRIQSFSDYVPRMVFDYVQVIADLAAKKLPAHAYTKEVLFVLQFGLTGAKINMSLVPDVVPDGKAPGLDANGNYIWNAEGTFPWEDFTDENGNKMPGARSIQKAEGYKENCGTIAVGISDEQIRKMLADPEIQMVIPYHKSSLNPIVAAMTNVDRFTDYTEFQNTKNAEGKAVKKDFAWDKKLFALTHYTRGNKKGQMKPKSEWGNVQDLVQEYATWCEERNYTPKFSQFLYMEDGTINPGYYKMLEDFALLDNDGNFKPQGDVQMSFPTEDSAFGSMKSLIEQGLTEDAQLEAKRSGEISGIVDEIEGMFEEGTLTQQSVTSEKLAAKMSISQELDEPYMDAVNSGNMEDAQRLVEEAAKMAGYDIKAFRGNTQNVYGKTHSFSNTVGTFFTSSEQVAHAFAGRSRDTGNYYLKMVNPLMLDAEGNGYMSIPVHDDHQDKSLVEYAKEDYDYISGYSEYGVVNADDIGAWADEHGYDGVIIENVVEGVGGLAATDYIIIDGNQAKSSDPITYAEDGSVIPLSQRFDPTNPDIRYSMPTQDADGNILSDGQMEYFKNSQARDDQGRLVPVYHTTNMGGFTIFDPMRSDDHRSLFFSSDLDVSLTYANDSAEALDFAPKDLRSWDDLIKYGRQLFSDSDMSWDDDVDENNLEWELYDKTSGDWADIDYDEWLSLVENNDTRVDDYRVKISLPYSNEDGETESVSFEGDSVEDLLSKVSNGGVPHAGYYQVYLNLENPMVIDAQGQNWDSIALESFVPNDMHLDLYSPEYLDEWANREDELYKAGQAHRDGTQSRTHAEAAKENDSYVLKTERGDFLYVPMDEDEMGEVINEYYGLDSDSIIGITTASYLTTLSGDFDRSGRAWANASIVKDYVDEGGMDTRAWAAQAQAEGYDGLIIRNVVDIGDESDFAGDEMESDIYVAFSSNQVKDMRNDNPSENPDIRYSIADDENTMTQAQNKAKSTDELWSYDPKEREGILRKRNGKLDFINSVSDKWNPAWLTEGKVLKDSSVENNIREVIMGAMRESDTTARYRQQMVKDTMKVAKRAYYYMKSGNYSKAAELLYDHSYNIVESLEFFVSDDQVDFERWKSLRDYLKRTKFTMPEKNKNDIDSDFRKRNFGKIMLGRNGIDPTEAWDQLHEMWAEFFPDDIKGDPQSIMEQIEAALNASQPMTEAYSSEQCVEFAGDIADSLYDIIYEGEEWYSLADRYTEKARAMKARHAEAMSRMQDNLQEVKAQHREEIRQLKAKNRQDLRAAKKKSDFEIAELKQNREYSIKKLQAEKARAVREERQKAKQKEAEARERRVHNELFKAVQKEYNDLTHRLLNPSKDRAKNIPEAMRVPLAKMLMAFDLEKMRSKELEEQFGLPTKAQLNFRELKDAIAKVAQEEGEGSDFGFINAAYGPMMQEIADNVDGLTIDYLVSDDIAVIKNMLKSLNKAIKNHQYLVIEGERQDAQEKRNEIGKGAVEYESLYGKSKKYYGVRKALDSIVNMGELTPTYFFRQIAGINDMYMGIRKGFDQYVRNEKMITEKLKQIFGSYYKTNRKGKYRPGSEIEKWSHAENAQTFDLSNDQTLTLTVSQMMSLYCLSKREQAKGHMMSNQGGVVAAETNAGTKLGKAEEWAKGKHVESYAVVLTSEDIQQIVQALTPEQMHIADQLQDLMSEDMSELGNKASMALLDVAMYKDKDYFPIKVQQDVLPTNLDKINIKEKVINPGFSKPLVPGANNAIVIDDIFSVVAAHCNDMNLYSSYAVPLRNFMQVYNGSVEMPNGQLKKTKEVLRSTYGDKAIQYIENFIDDINGNSFKRKGGLDDLLDSMLGRAKKAAVFANLRVALQQPTAIIRSFAVIDPKYFKGTFYSAKATEEMLEHCPIAYWKSLGYYDTHFGRDIEDVMMGRNNPSMISFLMSEAYGALDNMTWGWIWQAVKNEVKAKNPNVKEGTEEFWELCNERASSVFDSTQVVDSPMHRSNDMRSKNGLVKQLTSFQAEPTLSFNVLRQAVVDAHEAAKKGQKGKAGQIIGRMLAVWIAQAATVALAQSLVDALRRKNPDGDDDDDKTFIEFFKMNYLKNFLDDANAINNVYYFKDIIPPIWRALRGEYVFGSQNLTSQWLDTLTKGISQCKKKWERGSSYDKTWYDCLTELAGGFGYLFGLPFKTVMRGGKNALTWIGKAFGVEVFADDGTVDEAVENILSRYRDTSGRGSKSTSDEGSSKKGGKSSASDDAEPETVEDNTEMKYYGAERNKETYSTERTGLFGLGKSELDKHLKQKESDRDKRRDEAASLRKSTEGMTAKEKDKKIWESVTTLAEKQQGMSINQLVQCGDYDTIKEYRSMYMLAGGDVEAFDAKIVKHTKTALKKSIVDNQTEAQAQQQYNMRMYLRSHGLSSDDVSDVVYSTETKKELQVAFRINDEDAVLDEMQKLVNAGLNQEGIDKAYKYRMRVDLKKYKEEGGKYADRLKSTGVYEWAISGTLTSTFGGRKSPGGIGSTNHKGIDIAGSTGDPVHASDGGVVIMAQYYGGYGKTVQIQHDDGTITQYSHLSWWDANVGDTVAQGQVIGKVGSTGNSTGPHLHFGIIKNGSYVDPMKYLQGAS